MEKKVALKALKQIKSYLEDDFLNGQLLMTCQKDAMDLIGDLFGADSSHYETIRDAKKFSMGVQLEILQEEIDSIIMELNDATAIELSKASQDNSRCSVSSGKDEVFIVHGRDNDVKEKIANFLRELGLKPIILHEQPNKGRTIIEKFEYHSSVEYAVVLLTPDDVGGLKSEPDKQSPRARQNVIFEMGCFFGKLGRGKVCALLYPGVEQPSDLDGVVYIPLDQKDEWKRLLERELEAAGLKTETANRNNETRIGIGSIQDNHEDTSKEKGQFLEIASQMPDLISEMKKDLSVPEHKFVREFFLSKRAYVLNPRDLSFVYYEDEHPGLQGKIHVLENLGYIIDVTPGNVPKYRMKEDFVRLVLDEA